MGKDETKAGSELSGGLGVSPTLEELSLRVYEACEHLKCLWMRNAYGLSPEERVAQTLEYNKAKAALFNARKNLEDAIYRHTQERER